MFMQRRSQLDKSEKWAYFVSWCVVGSPSFLRGTARGLQLKGFCGWKFRAEDYIYRPHQQLLLVTSKIVYNFRWKFPSTKNLQLLMYDCYLYTKLCSLQYITHDLGPHASDITSKWGFALMLCFMISGLRDRYRLCFRLGLNMCVFVNGIIYENVLHKNLWA
jgi:hypothetical protein